jgi:glycosyltransferase involved in cell wall biosynthesis
MKIAIWHNLPSGGGKRALYDHVVGLLARGHTLEAWCPPTADREYLPLSPLIPEHVVDLAWPTGRFSDRFGITSLTARQLGAMDTHCRICAEEIGRGGFDILFANCCVFFRTTPIARFVSIPSVIYLGEPYRWLYEALPRLPWLAPPDRGASLIKASTLKAAIVDWKLISNLRLQAREEFENAAGFSGILVNSYFSRESVLRAYGLDADVCYLGINSDLFVDKNLDRTHSLVGLGSITPEKNVRLCIEAVGKVSAPRPTLIWVGNIADKGYVDEMKALAHSRDVVFEAKVGVSDSELIDILNHAIALLYAPRLEPFGLAPLEANACGVPVIAVAEGGVRETVVDQVNGLLVENNPVAMAEAIARLSSDPSLTRKLGAKARHAVKENWDLNAAIDRLEQKLVQYARKNPAEPNF